MEKSSLIKFIEKYRDSKLSDSRILTLWKREVDKSDFDRNEKEAFSWFISNKRIYENT